MGEFDPTKTPGTFADAPAHAPKETSQPLQEGLLTEQLLKAQANERELAPFNPQPVGNRMGTEPPKTLHATPRQGPPNPMPAASNTDTPSRGLPQEILDPGKKITGGFGPSQDAYYPLDGSELRELVRSLFDRLNERIQNDLRFHPAITYPRVKVRVAIEVEAYAADAGFTIELIKEDTKTPVDLARALADKVVFVLLEGKQEFAADGTAEDPPNRIRDELGLETPRKQAIETPGGRMMVDRKTEFADGTYF